MSVCECACVCMCVRVLCVCVVRLSARRKIENEKLVVGGDAVSVRVRAEMRVRE